MLRPFAIFVLFLGLAGCEIPPVDSTYISDSPADSRSIAVAQRAVRACFDLPDSDKTAAALRRAGFGVTKVAAPLKRGGEIQRWEVNSPNDAVSVLFFGKSCFVGVEGMTPAQSRDLAAIWAKKFKAEPQSTLSDHASGAWTRFYREPAQIPVRAAYIHKIYIAAFKTWPHGPYDPKRDVGFEIPDFPKVPGAAVEVNYVKVCDPHVKTGPRSGMFLPCE